MKWWIFETRAAAEEAAAAVPIPQDKSAMSGAVLDHPVTIKWADVVDLADGRFAFPAPSVGLAPVSATVAESDSVIIVVVVPTP